MIARPSAKKVVDHPVTEGIIWDSFDQFTGVGVIEEADSADYKSIIEATSIEHDMETTRLI